MPGEKPPVVVANPFEGDDKRGNQNKDQLSELGTGFDPDDLKNLASTFDRIEATSGPAELPDGFEGANIFTINDEEAQAKAKADKEAETGAARQDVMNIYQFAQAEQTAATPAPTPNIYTVNAPEALRADVAPIHIPKPETTPVTTPTPEVTSTTTPEQNTDEEATEKKVWPTYEETRMKHNKLVEDIHAKKKAGEQAARETTAGAQPPSPAAEQRPTAPVTETASQRVAPPPRAEAGYRADSPQAAQAARIRELRGGPQNAAEMIAEVGREYGNGNHTTRKETKALRKAEAFKKRLEQRTEKRVKQVEAAEAWRAKQGERVRRLGRGVLNKLGLSTEKKIARANRKAKTHEEKARNARTKAGALEIKRSRQEGESLVSTERPIAPPRAPYRRAPRSERPAPPVRRIETAPVQVTGPVREGISVADSPAVVVPPELVARERGGDATLGTTLVDLQPRSQSESPSGIQSLETSDSQASQRTDGTQTLTEQGTSIPRTGLATTSVDRRIADGERRQRMRRTIDSANSRNAA